jgi:hypothetical protein
MRYSSPNRIREIEPLPSISELEKYWTDVNSSVFEKFAPLLPQEWLQRHMAMTDEDYAKDLPTIASASC